MSSLFLCGSESGKNGMIYYILYVLHLWFKKIFRLSFEKLKDIFYKLIISLYLIECNFRVVMFCVTYIEN